ncbi:hypothetical protein M0R72_16235 [Candidatus Pacearchaeota archaeon]|jgi:hypothetical protein|nr:hypothetical protein [Candidatus Pacearchaeota archaeon]
MAEEVPTPPVNNQQPTVDVVQPPQKKPKQLFSASQIAILKLLNDGLPHLREDLIKVLPDSNPDCINRHHVNDHLTALRKKIRPLGHEIVCELLNRRVSYRHVRLLHSANDGRR